MAGPRATKVPRGRSRNISAWRRSMPSRSAARAMSMSRKVRPIMKFDASAATFFASLARRCVAMTPARPRLRPRHIRLVIAPSAMRRASSDTSEAAAGAKSCASSTTTITGDQASRSASNMPLRKAPAQRSWSSTSTDSRFKHDRDSMPAHQVRGAVQRGLGMVGRVDHHMAVTIRQGDEIALRVDHDLLHPGGRLFEQSPQQMRFSGARIALHQQAGGEQFLEVDARGLTRGRRTHLDTNRHPAIPFLPARESPGVRREGVLPPNGGSRKVTAGQAGRKLIGLAPSHSTERPITARRSSPSRIVSTWLPASGPALEAKAVGP